MKTNKQTQWLFFFFISLTSCNGQKPTDIFKHKNSEIENGFSLFPNGPITDTLYIDNAPNSITRTIIQCKAGQIYFASFEGLIKYDGHSFSNISKDLSESRFFSVLEDSKGNLWFGTIGEGVYCDDGKSIRQFTTKEGLINNEIVCIYEDTAGHIWFGANGGASMYDGKQFQNYILSKDTMANDTMGVIIPNLQRPPFEVSSIMEDKDGKLWFATRGSTFIYDGQSFTTLSHKNIHFNNVRSIIKDQEQNIWLGGNDGLWHYDYKTFTQYSDHFVGYVYEDSVGNIWTSSMGSADWSLSRYDITDSQNIIKPATEIKSGERMFFGILQDSDGYIWAGTLRGVYRYDGEVFTYFK